MFRLERNRELRKLVEGDMDLTFQGDSSLLGPFLTQLLSGKMFASFLPSASAQITNVVFFDDFSKSEFELSLR